MKKYEAGFYDTIGYIASALRTYTWSTESPVYVS